MKIEVTPIVAQNLLINKGLKVGTTYYVGVAEVGYDTSTGGYTVSTVTNFKTGKINDYLQILRVKMSERNKLLDRPMVAVFISTDDRYYKLANTVLCEENCFCVATEPLVSRPTFTKSMLINGYKDPILGSRVPTNGEYSVTTAKHSCLTDPNYTTTVSYGEPKVIEPELKKSPEPKELPCNSCVLVYEEKDDFWSQFYVKRGKCRVKFCLANGISHGTNVEEFKDGKWQITRDHEVEADVLANFATMLYANKNKVNVGNKIEYNSKTPLIEGYYLGP